MRARRTSVRSNVPAVGAFAATTLLAIAGCVQVPLPVAGPGGCGADAGPRVVRVVNGVRSDYGVPPLRLDPRLAAAAERHSLDMATHGFLGHTGSDDSQVGERALDAGYGPGGVGEVAAAGYATPTAVVQGWLRSRRHREILLEPAFVDIGAACAPDSAGALYWAAVLGAPAAGD